MEPVETYDQFKDVKTMLGYGENNYHDEIIKMYIKEVKSYMISAGVPLNLIETEKVSGVIAFGVNDLWILQKDEPSKYFYQRCAQLSYEDEEPAETETEKYKQLAYALLKEIEKNE